MLKKGESDSRSKMTSLQVWTQGHGTLVVHGWVAGWTVQPAGYEVDTPEAEVKVPVSGANGEADGMGISEGLAVSNRLDAGEADGDGEAEGDGTPATPFPDGRNGPTSASPIAATTITAVAAIAALVRVCMLWNLRGTRMTTRRC
jgi:hypothetical protein